jgi:hypothetical protein
MIDRKAIKIGEQVERSTGAGVEIPNEGVMLHEYVENGLSVVGIKAVVDGSEKLAGVAILPYMLPSQTTAQEQYTVPSSGSLIVNLRNQQLVSDSERAAVPGSSDLTIDETAFSATPPTGTVKVDLAGGRLKFAAGNAGAVVNFIYAYNLTVQQARLRFYERSINNRDLVAQLGLVGVAKGYIELSTDQFNSALDWTTGAAITLGDNGQLTQGGAGPVIPQGKVLVAPDLTFTVQGAMLRFSALIG